MNIFDFRTVGYFLGKTGHLNKMMFGRRIVLRCCGGFEFHPSPGNLANRAARLAMQSEKRSILLPSPTRWAPLHEEQWNQRFP